MWSLLMIQLIQLMLQLRTGWQPPWCCSQRLHGSLLNASLQALLPSAIWLQCAWPHAGVWTSNLTTVLHILDAQLRYTTVHHLPGELCNMQQDASVIVITLSVTLQVYCTVQLHRTLPACQFPGAATFACPHMLMKTFSPSGVQVLTTKPGSGVISSVGQSSVGCPC